MEKKIYTDGFERLLKEKSDEFRMYPSKRVWHSIYNDLHPGRRWPSFAMSMLLVLILLLTGYLNTSDIRNTKRVAEYVAIPQGSAADPVNDLVAVNRPGANTFNAFQRRVNTGSNIDVTDQAANNNMADPLGISEWVNGAARITTTSTDLSYPGQNYGGANNKPAYQNNERNNLLTIAGNDHSTKNISRVNNPKTKTVITGPGTENLAVNTDDEENTPGSGNTDLAGIADQVDKDLSVSEQAASKIAIPLNKNLVSTDEKAWMENYAMYNKAPQNKWKDRVAIEFYVTPSMGYRKLNINSEYDAASSPTFAASSTPSGNVNNDVRHKPSLGLEAGAGLVYSLAKRVKVKAGFQVNYTNYGIHANETHHPTLTTLLLNDENGLYPYLEPRTSTLANSSSGGAKPVTIHNKTYQVSLPLGISLKLSENNNLAWYAGISVQPSYVFGGKANLLSYDRQHYVTDASMIRAWNLNTGFETYVNYKMGGVTFQAGPQFRYQLLSTYNKKYTLNENLYNLGLKFGILKNF